MSIKTKFSTKIKTVLALLFALGLALLQQNLTAQKYAIPDLSAISQEVDLYNWDETLAPNYVSMLGEAQIETVPDPGTYDFQTDLLGRPSYAIGHVTYTDMVEGSERERDNLPNPVGWPKNAEVNIITPDGDTYHGWFWNRSHLIAKSLGGPDTKNNLVTGTRMQNVGANVHPGGMAYAEDMVRTYLKNNQTQTVIYATTPIYNTNEPIPRTVMIDILSSDKTLNVRLLVYNAQKGYEINYSDGTFTQTGSVSSDTLSQVFELIQSLISS